MAGVEGEWRIHVGLARGRRLAKRSTQRKQRLRAHGAGCCRHRGCAFLSQGVDDPERVCLARRAPRPRGPPASAPSFVRLAPEIVLSHSLCFRAVAMPLYRYHAIGAPVPRRLAGCRTVAGGHRHATAMPLPGLHGGGWRRLLVICAQAGQGFEGAAQPGARADRRRQRCQCRPGPAQGSCASSAKDPMAPCTSHTLSLTRGFRRTETSK